MKKPKNTYTKDAASEDAPNGGEVAKKKAIAANTLNATKASFVNIVDGMVGDLEDNVCTNTNVCFIAMSHLERTI